MNAAEPVVESTRRSLQVRGQAGARGRIAQAQPLDRLVVHGTKRKRQEHHPPTDPWHP